MVKTFVIAEAGSSWRIGTKSARHIEYAKKCIAIAKNAGAQAVKFQWTSDPRLMEKRRKVPEGTYTILAWPQAWLNVFAAECEQLGIEFMCTVFLPGDVPIIAPFVKRFKVASLEAFDGSFCQVCIDTGKPVIISAGACGWEEAANMFFPQTGWTWKGIKVLQCTAAYPAPADSMNLKTIWYGYDGLSDHSGDELTGALAVACGASIVEVHMRLDETRADNPDFKHSHAPWSLRLYVQNIRKTELMLGDGVKKIKDCERDMVQHRVTA